MKKPGWTRRPRAALSLALAVGAASFAVVTATSPVHAVTRPPLGQNIKVNQVAYAPGAAKQATVVNSSTSPLTWSLLDGSDQVVATGTTTVFGQDAPSGDTVHKIDFSSYTGTGTNFVLTVGNESSRPFDIGADAWKKLPYDALAFFYHQRSGIAINGQYVGGQYARPAGHLNVSPNQGDDNVPCRTSCGYTLDVRGGWYDAGDHGKYVVNGGMSAWQLVNVYERAKYVSGADPAAFGDGTMAIPERGNGVPDILDEARWEIDFMLKMQVPDGRPLAGMAHAKIHDQAWTGLPLRPDQDPQPRLLSAPTTAATLNLAASAAQCARVWASIDSVFSSRCLTAAEKAYAAAKANPSIIAPSSDDQGGGSYVDTKVTDEFYWAAAELYVTTGKQTYRDALTGSSLYYGRSFTNEGAQWSEVGSLGDITLALVPNGLTSTIGTQLRSRFVSNGDTLLTAMRNQGYPVPFAPSGGGYIWGSNNLILNNAALLALAYDFSGQERFRNGVFETMAYEFGRNPLGQSYVTGYGDQPSRNVHHRFWAHQLDSSLPIAPPGALAGGPNSGLQDPVAQERLGGCKPQRCYLDDINAWSVNEVAINWNAVLAWVSAWTAEKAGTSASPSPSASPSDSPSPSPSPSPS
ncbi:glycoside hydrolase family 9 protein, partial [Microbispora triticiradicis]|uniref:glycoside hydrolase family 9 protein n=1 Tax=Microbispora triticiradicis TaxID=2200763 RepID=UPI001AD71867